MSGRRVRGRLEVAGFKSIGSQQTVEMAPLTLLLGPNSAGKSSLLTALRALVAYATATEGAAAVVPFEEPDGFERLTKDGDLERGIRISLMNDRALRWPGWGSFHNEIRAPTVSIRAVPAVTGARVPLVTIDLHDDHGDILSISPWRLALNREHRLFADWLFEVAASLRLGTRHGDVADLAMAHFVDAFCSVVDFRWRKRRGRLAWSQDRRYEEDSSIDRYLGPFIACELALSSPESRRLLEELSRRVGVREANTVCEALEAGYALSGDHRAVVDTELERELTTAVDAIHLERHPHGAARTPYERAVGSGRRLLETLQDDAIAAMPTTLHLGPHRDPRPRVFESTTLADATAKAADVSERVSAWLGSDRLASGYRYVIEPLIRSSDAEILEGLGADGPITGALVAGYEHYLVDIRTGMHLSLADVGYGLSQVLPVLIGLHDAQSEYVLIEQPESQLHPALQADLADEMVRAANRTGLWRCIVAETHSEHIVLRLLRRIRETTRGVAAEGMHLRPEDVSLVFLDRLDGDTRVRHIRVSDEGWFLDPWPYGFFPERLEDLS